MEIDTTRTEIDRKLSVLLGGLSLIPYGIFALLTALSFWLGWLDWETNGGPPFLGVLLAFVISRAIQGGYYEPSFGIIFNTNWLASEKPSSMRLSLLLLGVLVAGWYIDTVIDLQIRLSLLVIALALCYRGLNLGGTDFDHYRILHLVLGVFGIGFSLLPSIFGISTNNVLFGMGGVLELTLFGFTSLVFAFVEHQILIKFFST